MTGSRLVPISLATVIVLAILNGLTHVLPWISPAVDFLTRPNERSVVEFAEAFLWFSSFLGFSWLLYRQLKVKGPSFLKLSYFTLALMCFLVLGEETSWGQHLGLISPSEDVQELNAQNELNLHNTNLSKVFDLSEDHPLYETLSNAGNLVSPIFQLFCLTAFGFIPLLYSRLPKLFPQFMKYYPYPSPAVSYFVTFCFFAYLIVNNLLFDVAILVELAMALTGLMVMLDRRHIDSR